MRRWSSKSQRKVEAKKITLSHKLYVSFYCFLGRIYLLGVKDELVFPHLPDEVPGPTPQKWRK